MVCSVSDKVLQDYFLKKTTTTSNILLLNEKIWKMYPVKIKSRKVLDKKIKKTALTLERTIRWNQWLRLSYETKIFNFLYEKKKEWIRNLISGRKSRFALYNYQGSFTGEESQEIKFSQLIRPIPQAKISVSFYFKNEELNFSLDIHEQLVSDPKEIQEVAEKIKGEMEDYLQSNPASLELSSKDTF